MLGCSASRAFYIGNQIHQSSLVLKIARTFVCEELILIVCVTLARDSDDVSRLTNGPSTYLLVDDYVNLYALLRLALEDSVQTPFLVISRRTAQVKFRSKPPVLE